jgi:membrane dipeptidase
MFRSQQGLELQRLSDGGLVWDNHLCMPLRPSDPSFLSQLERCREAGIDIVTLNVGYGRTSIEPHIRMLSLFRDWIAEHPQLCRLVLSTSDAKAAKAAGQLGVCFDIEGMTAVADQVDLVRIYYDLGVRWMLIAYNKNNAAGGGCLDVDSGLTSFGRKIIEKMNAVGMVLCCTHAGDRTAREAIDASSSPVIFSHSNPRAVFDHPRNIPDDVMRACAARGGVIGLNGLGIFLGKNDASIGTMVRHLEYALDLVGENHVGIGTDYAFDQDGTAQAVAANPEAFPPGLFSTEDGVAMLAPWQLPELAQALERRGHSTETLGKLFGGNLMRIAGQVWR